MFSVCLVFVSSFIFLIFILTTPRGLQNLSSITRDQTRASGSESAES